MKKILIQLALLAGIAASAQAQFVWPKPSDHDHTPGLYHEDPFITKYRKEFFAVFQGDYKTFDRAYNEIAAMVKKNPKDARALVWLGNGDTVKAGLQEMQGHQEKALDLLQVSRKRLTEAVSIRPNDPNIYMMQAATLYIQGQYFPLKVLPKSVWTTLRDDCKRFAKFLGPKIKGVSVHVRGETYGEMGVAEMNLGEYGAAIKAFEMVKKLNPNSDYSKKADQMIAKVHGLLSKPKA